MTDFMTNTYVSFDPDSGEHILICDLCDDEWPVGPDEEAAEPEAAAHDEEHGLS